MKPILRIRSLASTSRKCVSRRGSPLAPSRYPARRTVAPLVSQFASPIRTKTGQEYGCAKGVCPASRPSVRGTSGADGSPRSAPARSRAGGQPGRRSPTAPRPARDHSGRIRSIFSLHSGRTARIMMPFPLGRRPFNPGGTDAPTEAGKPRFRLDYPPPDRCCLGRAVWKPVRHSSLDRRPRPAGFARPNDSTRPRGPVLILYGRSAGS
jgi:hypothetical protein